MSDPSSTVTASQELKALTETAATVKGQKLLETSVNKDKGVITWNSFILVFAIFLLGILSANVVYFGRIVRFYDEATTTQISNLTNSDFPISRASARSIKIVNGILLVIPLVMIIVAIVNIALTAKAKNLMQQALKLASEKLAKEE